MRLWGAFAVAILLAAPACARADSILILSDGGAHCTVRRDGTLLGTVVIPSGAAGPSQDNPVFINSTISQGDVQVTCSLGEDAVAQTLRYHRVATINDVPLCVGGHPQSDCGAAWTSYDWRYPQVARLSFVHARSVIPQSVSFSRTGPGGPYRVTADSYRAAEAVAQGSAAANPDDLPFTSWRRSTADQQQRIGELTVALFKQGTAEAPSCAAPAGATGRLDIVDGGVDFPFEFAMACMTRTARDLVETLRCAAQPERADCKPEN